MKRAHEGKYNYNLLQEKYVSPGELMFKKMIKVESKIQNREFIVAEKSRR